MDAIWSVSCQVALAVDVAACFHLVPAGRTEANAAFFGGFHDMSAIK